MKVKVLHTADWHIGKQLHKYSLERDHELFFDWLIATIEERSIDLLLVSGDIFDTAFPSNNTLTLYYSFLTRLIGHKCKLVITGGNHDSPGVLNAPRDILNHLDIRIVGAITDPIDSSLIPFEELGIAVAAVPFLQEYVLRKSVSGQNFEDRTALIREGIRNCYQQLVDIQRASYPHLGLIGMGHMHVNGVETSESERDIHIVGNLAAFGRDNFPEGYEYIALGHIHKPQKLTETIRYSGSPIPLSFSERNDPKYVIELVFDSGRLEEMHTLSVPTNRQLRLFSGSLDEVWDDLKAYSPSFELEALVEVEVKEKAFDPEKSLRFDLLLQEFSKHPQFKIIKPRLTFENRVQDAGELFANGTEIEDLSPLQVFEKRLETEVLDDETKVLLLEGFQELLGQMEMN